jgi:hypothetical protein
MKQAKFLVFMEDQNILSKGKTDTQQDQSIKYTVNTVVKCWEEN